jgi:hypothetical protein
MFNMHGFGKNKPDVPHTAAQGTVKKVLVYRFNGASSTRYDALVMSACWPDCLLPCAHDEATRLTRQLSVVPLNPRSSH